MLFYVYAIFLCVFAKMTTLTNINHINMLFIRKGHSIAHFTAETKYFASDVENWDIYRVWNPLCFVNSTYYKTPDQKDVLGRFPFIVLTSCLMDASLLIR